MLERVLGGDALNDAMMRAGERFIAPLIADVRTQLLTQVAGDPPPAFCEAFLARMEAEGFKCDREVAPIVWRAMISALADLPSPAALNV